MTRRFTRNLPPAIAVLIVCACGVFAQSGRRSKQSPAPVVTPSVSAPAEKLPTTQKKWRVQFLVGIQDPSPFEGIASYAADTVLVACVARLNEASGVNATAGPRRLSRSDAVKAAKAETERYVVWLQVGNDAADASRQVDNTVSELYITYMLLEPTTANVKKSGRVQRGAYKVGNVGVGGPVPSGRNPIYSDVIIKDSAREAADKILSALGIRAEPVPR